MIHSLSNRLSYLLLHHPHPHPTNALYHLRTVHKSLHTFNSPLHAVYHNMLSVFTEGVSNTLNNSHEWLLRWTLEGRRRLGIHMTDLAKCTVDVHSNYKTFKTAINQISYIQLFKGIEQTNCERVFNRIFVFGQNNKKCSNLCPFKCARIGSHERGNYIRPTSQMERISSDVNE